MVGFEWNEDVKFKVYEGLESIPWDLFIQILQRVQSYMGSKVIIPGRVQNMQDLRLIIDGSGHLGETNAKKSFDEESLLGKAKRITRKLLRYMIKRSGR